MESLRFLCIGDVVGLPGLVTFQKWVPKLKEQYSVDAVIVNGENAAKNGRGITNKIIDFFKHNGAHVITSGNHVWENKEIYQVLNQRDNIIRPANFPPGCPGKGYTIIQVKNYSVAVVNIHGRVFMHEALDCPFRAIDSLLSFLTTKTNIILVDFHAEATSEKRAMGLYLDGKVSCMWGTHTHIQTADEQVLPHGSGYITDLGFCGALNSVIGMQVHGVLSKFILTHKMGRFIVEQSGPFVLSGIILEIDALSGKARVIERVRIIDNELETTIAPGENNNA
jgi:metallophosphoesterase (TIGR00282 family)